MTQPPKCLLIEVAAERRIDVDVLNASSRHPFEVEWQTSVFAAQRCADAHHVAAFVVDDSFGEAAAVELFRRLQRGGNNVPFVYVSSKPAVLSRFGAVLPDMILRPHVNHDVLVARLDELLGSAAFDGIVDVVTDGVAATLSRTFIPDARIEERRFRAGQTPVHEVNATIPLCGESISGRLSVSATADTLARIYRRLLPGRPAPDARILEDLVGEVSNQLLGGLKQVLVGGGIDFALGVPMMYTGSDCPVRYRSRTGSLLMYVRSPEPMDEIAIDLALDSMHAGYRAATGDDRLETGEVAFL
jgi:CheY-specific phosphatase CheX